MIRFASLGRARLQHITSISTLILCGLLLKPAFSINAQDLKVQERYDIVLRGGRVVDGTGSPWYVADVGILDGKIAKIGSIDPGAGQTELDVTDCVVAPGFIDMMGQTASPMLDDPATAMNLLTQGITTINAGEGSSAAPRLAGEPGTWSTMAEYFDRLDAAGLPVNVVQTVGHTQVRRLVLGDVDRAPTADELQQMCDRVDEAMQAGAIGVSTALIYPPAIYGSTEEIAALAEVAGRRGGRYYTHMRNEGDRLLEAIDEALEIGRRGGTPVHIFHLKAAGEANWHKIPLAIARIKAARAAGEQVTADIYPYINNGLGIAALIHPRHFAEGYEALRSKLDDPALRTEIRREMEETDGWENWFRHVGHDWDRIVVGQTGERRYADFPGRTIAGLAEQFGEDPWDTFFHLAKAGAFVLPESMTEANLLLAMQEDFVSFCTDVGPAGGDASTSHPRAFGAFPRLFSRYVRDLGILSLEQAVSQASAVAANDVLARDRGRVAEGLVADVIVFDPREFRDRATFAQPAEPAVGMKHVIVNGILVLQNGGFTGARPGRVLRGPGYRPKTPKKELISSGDVPPEMLEFDQTIREFLIKHQVPGASVAVTDQGRLVFARAYGFADVDAQQPVQPDSLFRIASISKPITAAAIMKLVESGDLALDTPYLQVLDLEESIAAAGDEFDSRQRDITIRHLLQHRGGWDRDQSFDPMFRSIKFAQEANTPSPAEPATVIHGMMKVKLDFTPGERYSYSNYGYCLLGRVIEKLSGVSYETYVQREVLIPMGATQTQIGATLLEGRRPNEVRYYDPDTTRSVFEQNLNEQVPSPYGGWYLEAMDAHGGWISSSIDLARFAVAMDRFDGSGVLSAASLAEMDSRPEGLAGYDADGKERDIYYSLGWQVRSVGDGKFNRWHSGSLPGTATLLIRLGNGRNFVALFNTRKSPESEHLGREADALMHRAAATVETWPTIDRFESKE